MKPDKPTWPCQCRRTLATSRCEDASGVKWLCAPCTELWWQGVHQRLERRGVRPV